ncbi:MAG TPA: S41 family peptidase, partial [Spirochaetota bacterium]|nr:S41 family peptidase [Spirochaetota bacterium]
IVTQNMVLYKNIFFIGSKIVAYMVYNEFSQASENEIFDTFNYFKENYVNELIIDLRYNPGGSVDISHKLVNLFAGYNNSGRVYLKMVYNDRRLNNYSKLYIKKEGDSLNLKRVFFITTEQSASASEAIINGVKPYMDVKLIGVKTHGKPVGMNAHIYENYLFFPITFKLYNGDGVGEYFEGLPVDKEAKDDVRYDFGDESDDCLKNALNYIENGAFNQNLSRSNDINIKQNLAFEYKGYNRYLNSF